MKRENVLKKMWVMLVLFTVTFTAAFGQQTEDLFLLGKIWGFLKYYHPTVTSGKVDWDKELLHFLPLVRQSGDPQSKSDSLLAWIERLGDIPVCATCEAEPPKDAK